MTEMHNYLSMVNTYIARRDGSSLATLLAVPVGKQQFTAVMKRIVQRALDLNPIAYCNSNIHDDNLGLAVGSRVSVLVAMESNDWAVAYQHQLNAYNAVLEYFKGENSNWIIGCLTRVMNDLRVLALQADIVLKQRDNEFLKDAQMKLTNSFTIVAKDRKPISSPDTKKLAIFAVTNVLFKIYFKLNTLQLCGKLINVVERPGFIDSLTHFPVSDVVTYKYYIGRLKMFEDRYEEARECLLFALKHCPKSCHSNRQRILVSLIPVQMCLGVMPSDAVRTKYGMTALRTLGVAVQRGDLRSYELTMRKHQRSFIRMGIFLVLEQVKIIAYRNLFKRIYLIKDNAHLWLGVLESVMRYLGEDADLDEIECIVANLIFQGHVKGYLSHQRRHLILSKVNPFPTSTIIKTE